MKKIVYLSLYERGERIASAGFASLQGEKDSIRIKLQIKNAEEAWRGVVPIYLIAGDWEIKIGELQIESDKENYERTFYCKENKAVIEGKEIALEEIWAIQVRFSENRLAVGEWKAGRGQKMLPSQRPEENEEKIKDEEPINSPLPEDLSGEELKAVSISSDKWEQLKKQYKTVHPFGDEREFISIDLKDFVVLRESYQKLANNSFLLHGFYNYRHLILGKDYQMGKSNDKCFYLGVPGVFFEREKMVAVMFGFEGFESSGPVEIGKFGYYLRRVEI